MRDDRSTADPTPSDSSDSSDPSLRIVDDMLNFLRGSDAAVPDSSASGSGTRSYAGPPTASGPDPADDFVVDPTPRPARWPAAVGPYRVIRQLPDGGMGVVYEATHRVLGRAVAVKTIKAGQATSPVARLRFRTEGAAVARLDHPNIVQIFEFGEDRGGPYFAMEWAPGGSLAKRIEAGPVPPADAAALVRDLARAMAYAHGMNVLHRDLKPNNVLIAADGTPKVADFGLARLLDDPATRMTPDDAVMGTPCYMAPEQAAGRVGEIDARTDVYGLGTILYESLTGDPPFTGSTKVEILTLVKDTPPARPSSVRPGLPRDLEEICLRCLEKNRADRYPAAAALAADLDRFLAGEPLTGRPWTRVRKAIRAVRRRGPELAIGLAVLAAGVGTVLALTPRQPTAEEKAAAKQAEDRVALTAALTAGGRVELIGTTGAPRYGAVVRAGKDRTGLTVSDDGQFRITTWAESLVELLDDPRREEFRLRVQILHDKSDLAGLVGVYVSDQPFVGPGGGENGWVATVGFNEVYSAAAAARLGPPPVAKKADMLEGQPNRVRLGLSTRGEKQSGTPWGDGAELGSGGPFTPRGIAGDTWRELVVDVTPDGITAAMGAPPVGRMTAGSIQDTIMIWKRQLAIKCQHPCWERLDPGLAPRGRLGLFVRRGSAVFRNATIEPIPPPERN